MKTFQVDYEAVDTKLAQMLSHVTMNINHAAVDEYRQIQSNLTRVDGATQGALRQAVDFNCQKAVAFAGVMERLFSFMANSSRQIQISEEQIARAFSNPRRS